MGMNQEEIRTIEIDSLTELIEASSHRPLVVIDENVWHLYHDKLFFNRSVIYKASAGENSKTFNEYQKCINFFISQGASRNSHLIAIGGGAVCDMAGLVAATILRGITWSVIPTTLLSMVDASVGGKVAINSDLGKNLIGAFHRPQKIYFCFDFLNTLSSDEFESGLGEILKYCFLSSEINEFIKQDYELSSLILKCVDYKKSIVDQDFKENGVRKILNYGHTFGHVIEKENGMRHGVAIMWGIYFILSLFDEQDNLEIFHQLRRILKLDHYETITLPQLDMITRDKKVIADDRIEVVRVTDIGNPYVYEMEISDLVKKAELL